MPVVDFDELVRLSDEQGRILAGLRPLRGPLLPGSPELVRRRELLSELEDLAERIARALGSPCRRPLECEPCPPCPN